MFTCRSDVNTLFLILKICSVNVAPDPAISDQELAKKLCTNREMALGSLEKVISKYANMQDDMAEEERRKRLEKEKRKKEVKGVKKKTVKPVGQSEAEVRLNGLLILRL